MKRWRPLVNDFCDDRYPAGGRYPCCVLGFRHGDPVWSLGGSCFAARLVHNECFCWILMPVCTCWAPCCVACKRPCHPWNFWLVSPFPAASRLSMVKHTSACVDVLTMKITQPTPKFSNFKHQWCVSTHSAVIPGVVVFTPIIAWSAIGFIRFPAHLLSTGFSVLPAFSPSALDLFGRFLLFFLKKTKHDYAPFCFIVRCFWWLKQSWPIGKAW